MEKLKDSLLVLQKCREDREVLREKYLKVQAAFEETNKELINSVKDNKILIDLTEAEIRETAVDEYMRTNEKSLFGGVGIRVGTRLEYKEEDAFQWGINHAMALKLDKKAFEKIVLTGSAQDIDFVKKHSQITATIPTKIEV